MTALIAQPKDGTRSSTLAFRFAEPAGDGHQPEILVHPGEVASR